MPESSQTVQTSAMADNTMPAAKNYKL